MIVTEEKILRTKCEDVLPEEVESLIQKLETELKDSTVPGIGLAAPQIGISKKAAIIRVDDHVINLINPKIVESRDKFIFEGEGCLSFPGKQVRTWRHNEIVVENKIEPKKFIATGLLAVVIQHEIDHLNNILLPDVEIKEKRKMRPNELCFCGSSKKYKRCHGLMK